MSTTVDKIFEEFQALPPEEKRQFVQMIERAVRAPTAQPTARTREQQWIAAHRDEYLGEWVVVEGDRLITHGHDARTVYDAAREAGIEVPFLIHVQPVDELPFGGW